MSTVRNRALAARRTASPLPLWLGVAGLVVSLALAILAASTAAAPVRVLGVPLPLVRGGAVWMSVVGYLLTPLLVFLAAGWDLSSQRANSLRDARHFAPDPRLTRWLLWLSGAALLLGAWHILNISVPVSEWLGL
ncbi:MULTISPECIES: hypothetical protein [unclassified Rathayibacter]|uniref:hypothetical protein n=1 Tax=unclassified Rathayibacter TaxID=2609250 RepID=UPI0006FB8498|nr:MULTISPECIES: hypothetical protein [unclassified Rathayibacter]KQQ03621.1 hypothetical protein ASF42_08990 [Rathayibacter sp. Leaf294]KQS12077.1 hypothetical protein ASG06_08990 [Rathayibacter sp. Leaf185]